MSNNNNQQTNNNNQGKRMSAFAQSAYAHATHVSTVPRNSFMGHLTNKFRGKGRAHDTVPGTIVDGLGSDLVQAEFHPLDGTSIVLITEKSNGKIMEESKNIGCTIESLGAKWMRTLDSGGEAITHALWIETEDESENCDGNWKSIKNDVLNQLIFCQSSDIPVVSRSWLVNINKLTPGQHWSEIDVEAHRPVVMNVLEKYNNHASKKKQPDKISSRRDSPCRLSASIGATYASLVKENPDSLEADTIKRAIELSMLDFAVVNHTSTQSYTNATNKSNDREDDPYKILRIRSGACYEEVRRAYRQRALETHPDKGGKPGEFEAVARAYRIILASNKSGLDMIPSEDSYDKDGIIIGLKRTSHWDSQLKEHKNLVRELYTNHGHDVDAHIKRQNMMLDYLGLQAKDAGSQSVNEKNERINNSCFYLSLSVSYLSGIGALEVWDNVNGVYTVVNNDKYILEADTSLIEATALSLKRAVEAAVLSAHPEWAAIGMVGEEVQAFSDFLVYTLESQTIVNEWAVVVFDTCSGFVDVYKGKGYSDQDDVSSASNTITIRFLPGHYQPLLCYSSIRPTLKNILSALDEFGVLYVITDGAS